MKLDFTQYLWGFFSSSTQAADAYVLLTWMNGFNIISPPPLSTVYLVSKVRAAQEGVCILLPLFPVFPCRSEKVVAAPTREMEREREGVGCWQSRGAAKSCRAIWPPTEKMMPPALPPPALSCFICKANHMPCSQRFLPGHLADPPAPRTRGGFTGGERLHSVMETSMTQKQRADLPVNFKAGVGGCNEAWFVTRNNHGPVFAFFNPSLHLPPLSVLPPSRNKEREKSNEREERDGGGGGGGGG